MTNGPIFMRPQAFFARGGRSEKVVRKVEEEGWPAKGTKEEGGRVRP